MESKYPRVLEFLRDLRERVLETPAGRLADMPFAGPVNNAQNVYCSIKMLEIEAREERRSRSATESNWERVKVFGGEHKLFERYAGDRELKAELLDFLNVKV